MGVPGCTVHTVVRDRQMVSRTQACMDAGKRLEHRSRVRAGQVETVSRGVGCK